MSASKLNDYVIANGPENVNQSVDKLGHSTESALLSIKNKVYLVLAIGETIAVVLLDQSTVLYTTGHGLSELLVWC